MHIQHLLITIGVVMLFMSCASDEPTVITASVGPIPRQAIGLLIVYTATEQWPEVISGDDTYRYPHTGYEIYATDERAVKTVRNALSNWDEWPTLVELREGKYIVRALSQTFGLVSVPVIIKTGKLTELHLERPRDWEPVAAKVRNSHYCLLPTGQVIGYRANAR